eukprot:gene15168-15309_t
MADDNSWQEARFPAGITGAGLGQISRQIARDEPPPLPVNSELAVIGKPVPRLNGRDKVTGAIRFTVDINLPGQLFGAILRSPFAHARVRSLDLSAARRHQDVRAVLQLVQPETPATAILRYVGAPLVAVAATSVRAANEALMLVRADYDIRPFVVNMDTARRADAPLVYTAGSAPDGNASGFPSQAGLPVTGNVRGPATNSRGDIKQGFGEADIDFEGDYRTHVQTHCCLEPHAIVADWRGDTLVVYMSTQFTAGVRRELAEAFKLPLNKVRVIVDGMGGGFGSKSTLGAYGRIAVLLSRQASAPVSITLDRQEEHMDSGNRPETLQHLRIGARHDGTLTAISLESYGSAGITIGAGVGNVAQSLYDCPNFHSAQSDVFINAGAGCAMRGPGNTPGAFALEQAMDELAERLAMDPLALRDKIDPSPVRREERRRGAERIGWHRRNSTPAQDKDPVKTGIGMAQSFWSANVQTNCACEVRIMRDGSVEVLSSVQDIGTGIGTILAQTVGETLGLPAEAVSIRIGDTEFPAGPPSYGSRTTASITPPARTAAWRVLQIMLHEVALALNISPEDLTSQKGRIFLRTDPGRGMSFREAAALLRTDRISAVAARSDDYGGFRRRMTDAAIARQDLGGVQFAEVSVDTETGIIRVTRVVAAQDCGRPMNPLLIESQVRGGILMGLSYALLEQRVLDRQTGRMLNADFEHYKVAGPRDTPEIEVIILENYQGQSATDAYGIAEPANIATAPAIANAVYNAIGIRSDIMNSFGWIGATTIAEAATAASALVADAMIISPEGTVTDNRSIVKAGGIDVLNLSKENLMIPSLVVSLNAIAELTAIVESSTGGLRIGSMATLAQVAKHALVAEKYPALSDALAQIASPQIRNSATLGGNLLQRPRCWYFRSAAFHCLRKGGGHCFAITGENQYHAIFNNQLCAIVHPSSAATALIALGATVELVNAEGVTRQIVLEEFFVSPGNDVLHENNLQQHEILTAILLPALPAGMKMAHLKLGEKASMDWPLAEATVALELSHDGHCTYAAIVLGVAAPTPHRAKAAEAALIGNYIDETSAAKAAHAALDGAIPLSNNAYKLPIFEALVRRTIMKALS